MKHFKKWNEWRKYNEVSIFRQLLVLFGLTVPPSFQAFLMQEEWASIGKSIGDALEAGAGVFDYKSSEIAEFWTETIKKEMLRKNPGIEIGTNEESYNGDCIIKGFEAGINKGNPILEKAVSDIFKNWADDERKNVTDIIRPCNGKR